MVVVRGAGYGPLKDRGAQMLADQGPDHLGVDESFDRYARMVRRALGVPVALVSLVEEDRQVFVGAEGLAPAYQEARETPLTHSFCQWVVHDQAPVVTDDARLDERLRDNLAIPDLGVVAYAGHPIPVYALGGIEPDSAATAVGTGAYGVAVMGAVMRAADPAAVVRDLLGALG